MAGDKARKSKLCPEFVWGKIKVYPLVGHKWAVSGPWVGREWTVSGPWVSREWAVSGQ